MATSECTAIITGASRGIGAAVATRLAADGFAVIINYAGSNPSEAETLAAQIRGQGGTASAVRADISDPAAVHALFDAAEEAHGHINVLVNNAGIMGMKTIAESDDDLFDRHVTVNLKGVFNGMREAARRMRAGDRIISFSSSVVGLYQPTYGVYAATKGGVEAMTHILANEMRGRGINVNAIAPGPIATELFMHGKTPEQIEHLRMVSPLERLGQPNDVAGVVSFLAGPDGAWINGQVIRANGGAV